VFALLELSLNVMVFASRFSLLSLIPVGLASIGGLFRFRQKEVVFVWPSLSEFGSLFLSLLICSTCGGVSGMRFGQECLCLLDVFSRW
jgi:hypothetical protein